jgi:transposase-like protein
MSVIRNRYSSQFKAQVVQELLVGEQTLSQIASNPLVKKSRLESQEL